jgi:hypothetical protein
MVLFHKYDAQSKICQYCKFISYISVKHFIELKLKKMFCDTNTLDTKVINKVVAAVLIHTNKISIYGLRYRERIARQPIGV